MHTIRIRREVLVGVKGKCVEILMFRLQPWYKRKDIISKNSYGNSASEIDHW
jgi:hypothetical protein